MNTMESLEAGAAKYGTLEAREVLGRVKRPEKKPANVALILGCIIVPLLIFVVTFYMMSFSVRYYSWLLAYVVAFLMLAGALAFGWMAYGASQGKGGDTLWLGLLCLLSIVAWSWAFFAADSNFQNYMQPYFELQQLNVYNSVDPSTSSGNQYMDFGVIGFVPGALIDSSKAMAFKNGQTYCAAPVLVNGTNPASYDFWAVGLNCCHNQYDYNCGRLNAHSGLRVARESLRSFYELTVMQAAATHDIKANNPVYFEMVADPGMQINGFQDIGLKTFLSATISFVCTALVVVVIAAFAFSKA